MKKKNTKKYVLPALACFLFIAGIVYYYFFSSISTKDDTTYIYIDNDDSVDSVYNKIEPNATARGLSALHLLVKNSNYAEHIRSGRYALTTTIGAFSLFRHLKNGMQTPVNVTIPSCRTIDDLCKAISSKLMVKESDLYDSLTSPAVCRHYGYDTATIACMFIPNTYDLYWNSSISKILSRMQTESRKFWNFTRKEKAKRMKLSPNEVITLASIVDEETANNQEKPMIAGMYYNRLMLRNAEYPNGMPLQADPTIKFAWKQFGIKRIYNHLLDIKSPYNTYKNIGLPPGPIRIPSVAGIDAVLNYVHHDYLYMCAKEDFSGTHNFAHTYEEHLNNATKYSKALNERGIK